MQAYVDRALPPSALTDRIEYARCSLRPHMSVCMLRACPATQVITFSGLPCVRIELNCGAMHENARDGTHPPVLHSGSSVPVCTAGGYDTRPFLPLPPPSHRFSHRVCLQEAPGAGIVE